MTELSGKTAVVTGATSGLGRAVAEGLARDGAQVIGIGRNAELCQQTERRLKELAGESGRAAVLVADLSLMANVRRVAGEIRRTLNGWGAGWLDVLINNAAAVPFRKIITAEGFEMQWAVNHLAPFLLTHEMLPLLKAAPAGRVVTVASASHYSAKPEWEHFRGGGGYNLLRTYGQTKLANVLFTAELNRRLGPDSSVHAFAANPGLVNTKIGMKSGFILARWFWDLWRRQGISAEESAKGILYLAGEPSIQDSRVVFWKHGQPRMPSEAAQDPQVAKRLWEMSEEACGVGRSFG